MFKKFFERETETIKEDESRGGMLENPLSRNILSQKIIPEIEK